MKVEIEFDIDDKGRVVVTNINEPDEDVCFNNIDAAIAQALIQRLENSGASKMQLPGDGGLVTVALYLPERED